MTHLVCHAITWMSGDLLSIKTPETSLVNIIQSFYSRNSALKCHLQNAVRASAYMDWLNTQRKRCLQRHCKCYKSCLSVKTIMTLLAGLLKDKFRSCQVWFSITCHIAGDFLLSWYFDILILRKPRRVRNPFLLLKAMISSFFHYRNRLLTHDDVMTWKCFPQY